QRADSATFASYDTAAKAEVADAFLSFLWLQHVRPRHQRTGIRQTPPTHLQPRRDSATLVP
ncbi:MAG: hypothetical protein ACJ8HF_01145, partial [Pseudomonas sp.]